MFFDMQQHEMMINDNEVFNNFWQSSSSSSGKRRCCKDGRNKFSLVFVATVSYRRRGRICRQNEWVSDGNNRILILTQFLPDAHCATCYLFRSSIDDYKHLTIISGLRVKKQSLFLKEIPHKVWSAHHENLEENLFFFEGGVFYRVNQRMMPSRSEDTFFFVLAVTLQKVINISK